MLSDRSKAVLCTVSRSASPHRTTKIACLDSCRPRSNRKRAIRITEPLRRQKDPFLRRLAQIVRKRKSRVPFCSSPVKCRALLYRHRSHLSLPPWPLFTFHDQCDCKLPNAIRTLMLHGEQGRWLFRLNHIVDSCDLSEVSQEQAQLMHNCSTRAHLFSYRDTSDERPFLDHHVADCQHFHRR